jgi:hypothetical protein
MLPTILSVSMTVSTPPVITLDSAQEKLIAGIFSEQMKQMVLNANSTNYSMYVFLIIAIVLMAVVVTLFKITANSMVEGVKQGIQPFVNQLGTFQQAFDNSFRDTQSSYEEMASKFANLTEKIIESQAQKTNEEDKYEIMMKRFQDLQANSFQYINKLEKQMEECKIVLTGLSRHCSIVGYKRFAEKLVDKGYATKEDVDEVIDQISKGD